MHDDTDPAEDVAQLEKKERMSKRNALTHGHPLQFLGQQGDLKSTRWTTISHTFLSSAVRPLNEQRIRSRIFSVNGNVI